MGNMDNETAARDKCRAAGQNPDEIVSGCRYDTGEGVQVIRCKSTGFITDVRRPRWHLFLD